MFESLSNIFQEKAGPLIQGGLVEPSLWFAAGAVIVFAGGRIRKLRAKRALTKSTLLGPYTLVGETIYEPTGEINPATGEEFFNQKIRNYRDSVALADVFNREVSAHIVDYINKARKHCTSENPVVLSHLDKVVPKHELAAVKAIIIRQWVNYFSSQLIDLSALYREELEDREVRKEASIWPLLIYEPDAVMKQYRVLLLKAPQLNADTFPKMANTRVLGHDQTWVSNPNGPQAKRLDAHLAIAKVLNRPENAWIVDFMAVNVPTGKTDIIPAPKLQLVA